MTLEDFRASGVDCDDLGKALRDECLEGAVGRLYADGHLHIERVPGGSTDWSVAAREAAERAGGWALAIGNDQVFGTLSDLEEALYRWADDEGYFEDVLA